MSKQKSKKFKRDPDEKIQKIIKTFYNLVKERGYNQVSTNLIAEVSGLSIGTIYRYFPKGKSSIVQKSFDYISRDFANLDDFSEIKSIEDYKEKMEQFIRAYLKSHRDNIEEHIAMDQAILGDRKLFEDFQETTDEYFLEVVRELRDKSPFFAAMPEKEMLKYTMFMYNVMEAFIHRHILLSPIFQTDEELIDFLTKFFTQPPPDYQI
jgi:AcrR family transcriptional regulator